LSAFSITTVFCCIFGPSDTYLIQGEADTPWIINCFVTHELYSQLSRIHSLQNTVKSVPDIHKPARTVCLFIWPFLMCSIENNAIYATTVGLCIMSSGQFHWPREGSWKCWVHWTVVANSDDSLDNDMTYTIHISVTVRTWQSFPDPEENSFFGLYLKPVLVLPLARNEKSGTLQNAWTPPVIWAKEPCTFF